MSLKPIIILNLKAYKEAIGENFYAVLSDVEAVAVEFMGVVFAIAPNILHIKDACNLRSRVLVFAQHADPVPYGAYTGHIPIHALKMFGVDGVIINHSERRVTMETIGRVVGVGRHLGLRTCVCAATLEEAKEVSKFSPTYVAFEPPELIGTGRSVSRMRPDDLKKCVRLVVEESKGESIPICGAGITSGEDVRLALEYGAMGVLVASAFVKAKNRKMVLREFAEAAEGAV